MNRERTEAAEGEVAAWRAARELPYPFFGTEHMDKFRDTLDYLPQGSPWPPVTEDT